ncbi:MAG: hypothetical protein AMXMBFR53_13270 [Gemmatimonadota bacterium]
MRRSFAAAGLTLLALLLSGTGRTASGQLISPGKLSAPHAGVEGIRNCTRCHELRKPGISAALCLSCHEPLAKRLGEGRGFHASVEGQGCATCHKEHFGSDFALVRLDTLAFDHARTGYALEGAHVDARCRACHVPENLADEGVRAFKAEHGALERTFLGLSTACATCHEAEQPHGNQFAGRPCADCHDTRRWEGADAFDHAVSAFPLTGAHADVRCADCHESAPTAGRRGQPVVAYAGIPHGGCDDCHEDQHRGGMPGACAGCHATTGWRDLDRRRLEATFDHRATGFVLEGRHARAACASCHDPGNPAGPSGIHLSFGEPTAGKAFPAPEATSCLSCHEDEHRGAMPAECRACHSMAGWRPVDARRLAEAFDHAGTGFPLRGLHAETPCAACHEVEAAAALEGIAVRFDPGTERGAFPKPVVAPGACAACHQDRHQGAFVGHADGGDCAGCHREEGWVPTTYDAARHGREVGFVLDGAHAAVACADCHDEGTGVPTFRVSDASCAGCHAARDPHGAQFEGRGCEACHRTDSFRIPAFDHDVTRFPLDGAHRAVPCASCHAREEDASGATRVRYRPMSAECRDCHGGRA